MIKIETHCHTSPASNCAKVNVRDTLTTLKEHGYDGVCITNHYTYYDCIPRSNRMIFERVLADYEEARNIAPEIGIKVFFGAELRFYENANDYLLYGLTPRELFDLGSVYELDPERFYKIKPKHAVFYQAHPFRINMFRADPRFLDGVEVYNGHPGHESSNELALKWAKENNKLMISGSDFHQTVAAGAAGIYVEKMPENERELAHMLKTGAFTMITPKWENTDIIV